LLRFVLICLCR